MKQNVAIVVMSCDLYKDLWKDFFKLKEKNWSDCPYNTYLVTNSKRVNDKYAKTITCGDELNWTGRLEKCLSLIPEKYIILMLEDYYISDVVSTTKVKHIVEFIEKKDVAYYKLETRGTQFPLVYDNSIPFLKIITPDIRYGVSLITSVWRKDFLLEVLDHNDYTAWEFEIHRNESDDITKFTHELCLCDERNILNIVHVVQRSKYIPSAIRALKKKGVNIDVSQRGKLSIPFDIYLSADKILKKYRKLHDVIIKVFAFFGKKSISEKYTNEIKKKMYK